MALQNFIDNSLPTVKAAWLNVVDALKFTVFDDATTKIAARTALVSNGPFANTKPILTSYDRTTEEIAVGITPTNYAILSHVGIGYVDPTRYGFSNVASGATNYTALVNAHTVAAQAGVGIQTPTGTFSYTPSAVINLAVNWVSPGGTTLNVDMTSYSGIVFQQIASTLIRGIYLQRIGTKQGIGLKQSPIITTNFTAYQSLDRVWIIGFSVNIDIENTFLGEYKDCRFNSGGIGIRFVPDTNGGDNGYGTTQTYYGCEIYGNDQNLLFTSTLQSRCIKFIGCAIEQPQLTTSTFTKCRELTFDGCYFEGSSSIRALTLNDCTVNFANPYFSATGGIQLGTNTEILIQGLRITSATDILTGGDSTQIVTLIDSQFPSSGNSLSYLKLMMLNTSINGTFYEFYTGPRSTATLTLTGCTTSPTGVMSYTVTNDIVTALIPAITGTSNTIACTLTGIPVSIRPATTQFIAFSLVYNNTANAMGLASIDTAGIITLYVGAGGSFTAAGIKGNIAAQTISWKIAA